MRRFNLMLNGSRLMMFPFYVCILVCVALLMVKFAMQLYTLCRNIIDIHYLDLITGVLTLVDFVLVAQMLILVAICGYLQFIQTPEQRAAMTDTSRSKRTKPSSTHGCRATSARAAPRSSGRVTRTCPFPS